MAKFIPLLALFLANEADAWWDAGHWLAGCVARQTLISKGRQDVVDSANKLLALYDYNGVTNDICRAACWLDWIKSSFTNPKIYEAIGAFNSQHYIDFITTPDHSAPTDKDIDDLLANVTYIHLDNLLSDAMRLVPPKGGAAENYGSVFGHSLWMRWLLHLMGDAHQPMHMTAMHVYEPEWDCDGTKIHVDSNDAGGNGIQVQLATDVEPELLAANPGNLHALWDSMGGYGNSNANQVDDEEMFSRADDLIANYPMADATADKFKLQDFTLKEVYKATALLAANDRAPFDGKFVYEEVPIPEFFCPSEFTNAQKGSCCKQFTVSKEHGQWVKETSKKMVAIAGYRIADILEKWHDGLSTRLAQDIEYEYNRQTQTDTGAAAGLIVGGAAVAIAAGALLY